MTSSTSDDRPMKSGRAAKGDDEADPFTQIEIPHEEISFLNRSQNYCICFIDMVTSTKITAEISDPAKIRSYYSMFLNATATIAKGFNAKIIKNIGDALVFYFPDTSDPTNRSAFVDVINCCTSLIGARDIINIKLHTMDLPSVSYRISADYGRVEIASSTTSKQEDFFGPTMSLCAKINSRAEVNGIVFGGDLYTILKALSLDQQHQFKEIRDYSLEQKHAYPVYALIGKTRSLSESSLLGSKTLIEKTPRSKTASTADNRNNMQEVSSKRNSRTIMLVDDNEDILLTYKSFLSGEGYKVEVFSDPEEALQQFAKVHESYYALIILDIRMPYMNGLQLYNRLKTINKSVNIVFISALDAADELVSLIEGIKPEHVIKKPVNRENFMHAVKSNIINA